MLDDPLPNDVAEGVSPWSTIGRPARSARARILAAATELFCREGYATVGVDTVALRSGAAKSTLYKHFASKDQLIAAVLEAEGAAWRAWFFARLGQVEGGPRSRLLAVFDVLEDWFSDPNYYGCPFLNAISEAACADDRPRELARGHKAPLDTWLRSQALELGRDPDALAQAMVVLIDGAITAAHAARNPGVARSARDVARAYLDRDVPA